ncbi:MAG: hypothetical protein IAG10_06680, partial [Planctomycetaceae bacterium]|nr:hypothetical protein [Planctomycetaceae bacterium]
MNCCRGLWRFGKLGLLVAASGLLLASLAPAQEPTSGLGRSTAYVAPGGLGVYRPEKWGQLNVQLVNPTDEPLELLTATFFQDEPTLQYGRRSWLPPKSKLQTWHPLRLPRMGTNGSVNIRTLVMDARQEREVLLRSDGGYLQVDGILRVTDEEAVTGMIEAPSSEPAHGTIFPDENFEATSQLVIASRLEAQRTRRLTVPLDQVLPAGEECLQALDQMVITDSRMTDDSAGLTATRRWLFGGGRLWVMLDQADPRVLERLLGDEFVCEIVDRVGLTTVRLGIPQGGEKVVSTQDYEQPVDFLRVAVSDVDVAYTVDGWPAAFWKTCGEGRLLVTTLAPRGWMRRRTAADNRPTQNRERPGREPPPPMEINALDELRAPTRNTVLEPMSNLALDFFSPRLPRLLSDTVLEPLTQEYVGYSIPSRPVILGLLLGFSALLMGLGIWLWRLSRLELLGAIGPGVALAISVILVLLGRQQRNAVPPTVANLQFVQAIPGTDDIRVSGVAGLFSMDVGTAKINAQQGGWLLPDVTGLEATTRRMVWTDLDAWQWEHLPETAGIRSATFQTTIEQPERLEARATFGPEGLTGRLHLPSESRATDAMLATRDGRFGVELRSDGTLTAKADNVLSDSQFLAGELLSDEQDRRRRLLQQLLANPLRRDFPEVPHLLVWTEPWDIGFRFDENRRSLGSALLAVPLKLLRPAVGAEVRIASPFLPYRGAIGPDDTPPTGWWDSPRHLWIEKSRPAETWIRFQIPTVLLPIAIERGRVTVQVKGPVGKLTLAGYQPKTKAVMPLKIWTDPVGTLSVDITDPELVSVSPDGGLLLRVSGGDPDRPELTQQDATADS